ncbi:MAG: DUF4180 domain-containing protein [Bacteroidota bacterium]
MKIETHKVDGVRIAEVISDDLIIGNVQDGLDLLGNLYYEGFTSIIIHTKNITPDFFDLRTGIAGELLQKYSNYRVRLAVVGDFNRYSSKSMKAFIFESNKLG